MKEKKLANEIMLELSSEDVRLFRNNVGKTWIGNVVDRDRGPDGLTVVIKNARRFNAGLTKGSSDLIGWTTVKITEEMVGREVAVFTAFELKTGRTRTSTEQLNFVDQIRQKGGISGIIKELSEAKQKISEWIKYRI